MKSNLDKDIERMIKSKTEKAYYPSDEDIDEEIDGYNQALADAFGTIRDIEDGVIHAIGILENSADKCPRVLGQIESAFPDTGFPMMRSDFIPIYERIVEVLGNLKDIRDGIYNFRGNHE